MVVRSDYQTSFLLTGMHLVWLSHVVFKYLLGSFLIIILLLNAHVSPGLEFCVF